MVSEGLPDGEVEPELPGLGFTVDDQARNRIQLVAEVRPQRSDWRHVAETRADVVAQLIEIEVPRVLPDVAGVGEEHRAEAAAQRHAQLGRALEHRVAADREPGEERRDFESPPAAQARGAAEEIAAEERHLEVAVAAERANRSSAGPHRE